MKAKMRKMRRCRLYKKERQPSSRAIRRLQVKMKKRSWKSPLERKPLLISMLKRQHKGQDLELIRRQSQRRGTRMMMKRKVKNR